MYFVAWIFLLLYQIGIFSAAGSENPQTWHKLIRVHFSHVTKKIQKYLPVGVILWHLWIWGAFSSRVAIMWGLLYFSASRPTTRQDERQRERPGFFFSWYVNFRGELLGSLDRILLVTWNGEHPLRAILGFVGFFLISAGTSGV